MISNKLQTPCRVFLEYVSPDWPIDICLACEWARDEHPDICPNCFCDGTGEIWGPCEVHKNNSRERCVVIARCDCDCHIEMPVFKLTSKTGRKRLPTVLPYIKVAGHKNWWEKE